MESRRKHIGRRGTALLAAVTAVAVTAVAVLAAACGIPGYFRDPGPAVPGPSEGPPGNPAGEGSGRWTAGTPGDGSLQVVTTTFPLFEFVKAVGDDRIFVVYIGAGADPHGFDPSPRDLELLSSSRLVIYNGAGLEPWLEPALAALTPRGTPSGAVPHAGQRPPGPSGGAGPSIPVAVDATEGLPLIPREGSDTGMDPHVWLDPLLARKQVDIILEALAAADEAGRAAYEENAEELLRRLDHLHQRFHEELDLCSSRVLAVEHGAFIYLARRYQLQQVALAPADHDMEPSPRHLARAIRRLRSAGSRGVFATDGSPGHLAETAAMETGARVLTLHTLEVLSPEQRDQGETYFTLMESNLQHLKEGLGCR